VKRIKVLISGSDCLVAALLICCAFDRLSWGWFWLGFILNEINGALFYENED
jgi:hypothetical protein